MTLHDDPDDRRYLTMAEVMTPEKANFAGNVHGGYILEFLDRVAYACAARYSGLYVVTLSVDQVIFKQAIHVGELITCKAAVNYVGRSSMEIGIKIVAENLTTAEKRHTNSCFFTMVALDEHHKPAQVTALQLNTADEKRRYAQAQIRRQMQKEYQQQHRKAKSSAADG